MRTRKTYIIPGLNAAKLIFCLNGSNARFRVEFTGGSTFNNVPASFTTADPACQAAIEGDDNFGKRIFISSVYNFDENGEQLPDSIQPDEEEGEQQDDETTTSVKSVTDINSLRKYLKDTFGISGNALRSKEAIKKQVVERNLTFPNFKFKDEEETNA